MDIDSREENCLQMEKYISFMVAFNLVTWNSLFVIF